MPFLQPAPVLNNQYLDDRVLRSYLRRVLPPATLSAIEPDFTELGEYASSAWESARRRTRQEPQLTQWSAWGERIDRLELTPAWRAAKPLAVRMGLVAAGHETGYGNAARVHQFAMVYLFHCASEFYTCPLAMTDGAATALKAAGNKPLIARAMPHFLSRDAQQFWTSGQWMTETAGGSDVAGSETLARKTDQGWRLYGRKWFASAIDSQAALALARPEGAETDADALTLFYVEPRDDQGRWRNVLLHRLKDKLGTRELPTAEIQLDGTPAELAGGIGNGVRQIAPVLNITRTWNAVGALATMRRCIALLRDYANRRIVFGRPLIEQPLFRNTLADMQSDFEAAFHLTFLVTELLGREQGSGIDQAHQHLLRLITPLAKLWTAKLAVNMASETCECFGGMGYVEDSGIPQLLRDAQVWPIWEGAGNVQALDVLRALREAGGLQPLLRAQQTILSQVQSEELAPCVRAVRDATAQLMVWYRRTSAGERDRLESGARDFALSLARTYALALLARHAEWSRTAERDPRPGAAALRFARRELFDIGRDDPRGTRILARDSQ